MAFLIPIFIVGFVFGTISWIAFVILEAVRSRQRIQATSALQGKLIDRLGADDIGVFLNSENGSQMLRALQSGLVLSVVGLGMFLYSGSQTLLLEVQDGIRLFATLALSLGVGLLLAAGASYRMSKRMGLLKTAGDGSAPAV